MTSLSPQRVSRRVSGLRATVLAAVVMLLIQYCLGISFNLYSTLPASDHGGSLVAGFTSAVGDGPLLLSRHALLGTLLLITAVAAVIRSSRVSAIPFVVLTVVALLAIIVARLTLRPFDGGCDAAAVRRPSLRPRPVWSMTVRSQRA